MGGETYRVADATNLVGLDERPRPATMRARVAMGLKRSAPFSSLQRRIIFFNLTGLALLVSGVLYLNTFRSGLIEQRVEALRTQGEIIAITIAESSASQEGELGYDPVRANTVLNRLVQPTGVRARLYDRQLRLTGDTRNLSPSGAPIEVSSLPPPGEGPADSVFERVEATYKSVVDMFRTATPLYQEISVAGISSDPEVRQAASGAVTNAVRVNSEGDLIVSVAMPVTQFKAVLGVLVLSTEGDDINQIVRRERIVILQVFVIATLVSVALSILLANTIANPIRRLARAADPGGAFAARPLNPDKIQIPDMTHRSDEIGDLSVSLIRMTDALYRRIEAIESFAADVAHEIKNPLTSLRSAVETMQYAKTPEQQQRLFDVIQKDVSRMDRLVTDISNASRLDAELVRGHIEEFDLGGLVTMLAEVAEQQGHEKGVTVECRLPEGELVARGLEGRIAQVITNLLDNALSFSPDDATLTVEARRLAEGAVRVTVMDEGPGIPPDNLGSIFERFYSERPVEQGFGDHSGLGLSISKQIMEAHGGKIWAENVYAPGSEAPAEPLGARFVFELPG
ncbi:MAG: sensor histidine kinase [Pseudomonadota bacterium]